MLACRRHGPPRHVAISVAEHCNIRLSQAHKIQLQNLILQPVIRFELRLLPDCRIHKQHTMKFIAPSIVILSLLSTILARDTTFEFRTQRLLRNVTFDPRVKSSDCYNVRDLAGQDLAYSARLDDYTAVLFCDIRLYSSTCPPVPRDNVYNFTLDYKPKEWIPKTYRSFSIICGENTAEQSNLLESANLWGNPNVCTFMIPSMSFKSSVLMWYLHKRPNLMSRTIIWYMFVSRLCWHLGYWSDSSRQLRGQARCFSESCRVCHIPCYPPTIHQVSRASCPSLICAKASASLAIFSQRSCKQYVVSKSLIWSHLFALNSPLGV